MSDEYNYWITYIDDERALKAVWGNSDHRHVELNNSTNPSPPDDTSTSWTAAMVSHAYLETMLVFLFAIILYFSVVFWCCEREREITKHEVDKSVITRVSDGKRSILRNPRMMLMMLFSHSSTLSLFLQRVLPHGQSQDFNNPIAGDETPKHCWRPCFTQRRCSMKQRNRKQTHPIPSAAETASEILEMYRTMSDTQKISKPQTLCAHCSKPNSEECVDRPQGRTDDDYDCSIDISLAEEGLGGLDSNRLTCPICFEPFLVEEKVTWSRIGNCRHVFHYDCILPWAVLGNFECPVCRAQFWSKTDQPTRRCLPMGRLDAEIRQSRFCVQHGLVSP